MTQQEMFEVALEEYAKIESEIDELSALVQKAHKNFSAEVAKRQFDLILQTMLLKAAIANDEFCYVEKEFISKITSHTSITELFKDNNGNEITWEQLVQIGKQGVDFIMPKLEPYVQEKMEEFIKFFAPMDAVMSKDYLVNIQDSILVICKCFVNIDGEVDDSEAKVLAKELSSFVGAWDKIVKEGEEYLRNKNRADGGNSLKSNFLKKNS